MTNNNDVRAEISRLLASPDAQDRVKAAILDAEYSQAQNEGTADFDPEFLAWKIRGGNL